MIWSLNNCGLESKSPVLLKLEGHDGVIMDVKFLKKDVVASVSDDRSLRIWRLFIDDDKYQEMKRFEVKTNDIIMSCSGTYGKIAVVPEGSPKGIINQALLKITPGKGVGSHFIKHWMQSSLFQVELEKDIGGAALQNVPSVARMK